MLKSSSHFLGHGAKAAHQTLDLWILVRIQVPQPDELILMEDDILHLCGANEPDAAESAARGSFAFYFIGAMV